MIDIGRSHDYRASMACIEDQACNRLLRILLDHPNRVLNRDQLTEMIHGRDADPYDRAIDVQISRLRQRLRDDSRDPVLIKTVRGEGYVLASAVEEDTSCA